MHIKTIIFVNNVALDHRTVRKLDDEGSLWALSDEVYSMRLAISSRLSAVS